jgi:predicted nuclease of predicted toxin-antitoxin system
MDVHVPQAITDQLRRRGVDVLTAIEDSSAELTDEELLERASSLERVLFTQDIALKHSLKIGSVTNDHLRV